MTQINDNFIIGKWVGIKNDETKQIEAGHLYITFIKDIALLNSNGIDTKPRHYKASQTIGFYLQAKNKKQAIFTFGLLYKVEPNTSGK